MIKQKKEAPKQKRGFNKRRIVIDTTSKFEAIRLESCGFLYKVNKDDFILSHMSEDRLKEILGEEVIDVSTIKYIGRYNLQDLLKSEDKELVPASLLKRDAVMHHINYRRNGPPHLYIVKSAGFSQARVYLLFLLTKFEHTSLNWLKQYENPLDHPRGKDIDQKAHNAGVKDVLSIMTPDGVIRHYLTFIDSKKKSIELTEQDADLINTVISRRSVVKGEIYDVSAKPVAMVDKETNTVTTVFQSVRLVAKVTGLTVPAVRTRLNSIKEDEIVKIGHKYFRYAKADEPVTIFTVKTPTKRKSLKIKTPKEKKEPEVFAFVHEDGRRIKCTFKEFYSLTGDPSVVAVGLARKVCKQSKGWMLDESEEA